MKVGIGHKRLRHQQRQTQIVEQASIFIARAGFQDSTRDPAAYLGVHQSNICQGFSISALAAKALSD